MTEEPKMIYLESLASTIIHPSQQPHINWAATTPCTELNAPDHAINANITWLKATKFTDPGTHEHLVWIFATEKEWKWIYRSETQVPYGTRCD